MAELSFQIAKSLAGALVTMGHPYSQAAIDATALDLVKWCKGVIRDGRIVSPEQQAANLVDTARETWDKWPEGGTKQLCSLFHELFDPHPEFEAYELPPPAACAACGDTGWEALERRGLTFARACRSCGGKRKATVVCPDCAGKETRLVDGRREPCSTCISPERRRAIAEWLQQQREAS